VRIDLTPLTVRVRGAIAAIGLESELVLRADPATAALLRTELVGERRLRIDEDPRMTPGAVEIEGGVNRLDAGIDAAIESVAAALREEVSR
jgi:flagellar biosynthesis/type III secretory pathway protein FliH